MRKKLKMLGHDGSGNILAPNLTLKITALLENFPRAHRDEELNQVTYLILRNISNLRQLYHFYCTIGHNKVQSTKSEMTRLQFWRFIKDSQIHHYGLSLPEMDRIVAPYLKKDSIHQPTERLSLSDFLSSLTILSFVIFKEKVRSNHDLRPRTTSPVRSQPCVLKNCLQMLMNEHIRRYSGRVGGGFLFDNRKAINALKYMEGSWKVYKSLCDCPDREPTLIMRKLLLALREFEIIGPRFSTEAFLNILHSDHPRVFQGGAYNLEIEIDFLEYFEALVATAAAFVDDSMVAQHAELMQTLNLAPPSSNSSIGHSRPSTGYSRRSSQSARSVQSLAQLNEDGASENVFQALNPGAGSARGDHENVLRSQSTNDIGMASLNFEYEAQPPQPTAVSGEVSTQVIREREKAFETWSNKLCIFFTKYLFPAWQRSEILRREAARHRTLNHPS